MKYESRFEHEGKAYFLSGNKEVEDNPVWNLWKDTTALFIRLHAGVNAQGLVLGAGVVRITLLGILRQLLTMRTLRARSFTEAIQGLLAFAHFFVLELCDTYRQR